MHLTEVFKTDAVSFDVVAAEKEMVSPACSASYSL